MSDTCPKEYTPSTEEVRDAYNVGVDPEFYGAEFDRWHQAELRRAKAEAWEEAISEASEQGTIQVPDNPYRVDQTMEDTND